ncbi:MAG: tRNA uridine-5-carboxymethylaminomethyl(34) synthesis enzyme MnmG, partial [Rikenellaceae bacterium]|nr:tRNA uridine-5-carboxymethylaminomethyl(34) synthesis enzyme MnmG [Rikenellaceae bacterium]
EELFDYLTSVYSPALTQKRKLFDILLRNEITIAGLAAHLPSLASHLIEQQCDKEVVESAEIRIKYGGYIERERQMADKLSRLERISIRTDFDFNGLTSLSIESRQKLSRIRPATIGQASRIPGVSPADINVLLVYFGR